MAVGLWAAAYPAAFILAIYALHRLVLFLTPCDTETTDMADLATDAAERAATREMADARPDAPTATPSMGGGLGGAGLSLVFLEDHGGSDDPEGISRLPVAEACQSVPCDLPSTIWRPGDVVTFDNGRTRHEGVRLVGMRSRRAGWWKTGMSGVDLHEVYFRRAD